MVHFTKKTSFYSIEIVLKTNHSCKHFVRYFLQDGHCVLKLKCESHKWYIYFAPTPSKTPEKSLKQAVKLIQKLPAKVRKDWDQAEFREFNLGYSAGEEPNSFLNNISCKTLRKVSKLGAGIGISIYPAVHTDPNGLPMELYT